MQLGFEWGDLIPSADTFSSIAKAAAAYDSRRQATRIAVAQIQANSRRQLDDQRAADLARQVSMQQYPVPGYSPGIESPTQRAYPLPVYRPGGVLPQAPTRHDLPSWAIPVGAAAVAAVLFSVFTGAWRGR